MRVNTAKHNDIKKSFTQYVGLRERFLPQKSDDTGSSSVKQFSIIGVSEHGYNFVLHQKHLRDNKPYVYVVEWIEVTKSLI